MSFSSLACEVIDDRGLYLPEEKHRLDSYALALPRHAVGDCVEGLTLSTNTLEGSRQLQTTGTNVGALLVSVNTRMKW